MNRLIINTSDADKTRLLNLQFRMSDNRRMSGDWSARSKQKGQNKLCIYKYKEDYTNG